MSSDSFSTLICGVLLVVVLPVVSHLAKMVWRRKRLVDDKGNQIPHGPVGLPIIGVYLDAISR